MKRITYIISSIAVCGVLIWAGYRNVKETKLAAPVVLEKAGFKIAGYEGYQWGVIHGGKVWFLLHRIEDNGTLYNCYLSKWGMEYHIYNLEALDALKTP